MNTPDLLLKLIKDNLRTTKLVDGLGALGLYSSEYYNQHHIEILQHYIGKELNEDQKDTYYILSEKMGTISIENNESIENLANEIYTYIVGIPST